MTRPLRIRAQVPLTRQGFDHSGRLVSPRIRGVSGYETSQLRLSREQAIFDVSYPVG